MMFIIVIIIALMKAALAQGSVECTFTEAAGAQPCSVTVGQLLMFHLPSTSEIRLKKDNKFIILKTNKNRTMSLHLEYAKHAKLFGNGSFVLGHAMKNHSGDYMLEEYGLNGNLMRRMILRLKVKAPVPKPAVSQMCLSAQQMDISCSSRLENTDFNVTLDGLLLIQTRNQRQFLYGTAVNIKSLAWNKTQENHHNVTRVIISLHGQLTGNLTCRVWNDLSREETVFHLESCKILTPPPSADVMAVRNSVGSLLLLSLCLAICFVHWKTRTTSIHKDTPQNMFSTDL